MLAGLQLEVKKLTELKPEPETRNLKLET